MCLIYSTLCLSIHDRSLILNMVQYISDSLYTSSNSLSIITLWSVYTIAKLRIHWVSNPLWLYLNNRIYKTHFIKIPTSQNRLLSCNTYPTKHRQYHYTSVEKVKSGILHYTMGHWALRYRFYTRNKPSPVVVRT